MRVENREEMMGVKKKKEKEPEFFMSATNIRTINYNVYYMKLYEKILYFVVAFLVGALVGYIFYGGIGVDEFGEATKKTHILNAMICTTTGSIAGIAFIPIRTKQILAKRKGELRQQFRELLDSLVTSLGSGKNVTESFGFAKEDLRIIYEEDSYIMQELSVILTGLTNNISIESMLMDFAERSGNQDIRCFARIFETCYRKGGNIKEVIRNTQQIINDKMEIELEIETIVTANKTEQNIMMIMPVALIGMIKFMSPELTANFTSTVGIIATTVAVAMFVMAYFVGKAILDIKI